MAWFRIDNRLVHGQVIEGWLPYLGACRLVVVNDELAEDELQQQIMKLAIPDRISVSFISVHATRQVYEEVEAAGVKTLFLLSTCRDVTRLMEKGVSISLINIGNLHYSKGKRQICSHVAASDEDIACFDALRKQGVTLDFRCVPGDTPVVKEW